MPGWSVGNAGGCSVLCGLATAASVLCAAAVREAVQPYTAVLAGCLALDNAVFAATGIVTAHVGRPDSLQDTSARWQESLSVFVARWITCITQICTAFSGLYTLQMACAAGVEGAGSDTMALLLFAPLPIGLAIILCARELLGWLYIDLLAIDVRPIDAPFGSCMARQAILPALPACFVSGSGRPPLQLRKAPSCGIAQWRPPTVGFPHAPRKATTNEDQIAVLGSQLALLAALRYGGQAVWDSLSVRNQGDASAPGCGELLFLGGAAAVGLNWTGRILASWDQRRPKPRLGQGGSWVIKAIASRTGELFWLASCHAIERTVRVRTVTDGTADPLSGCTVAALLQIDLPDTGPAVGSQWGTLAIGAIAASPIAVVALQCAGGPKASNANTAAAANGSAHRPACERLGERWAPFCFPCFAAAIVYGLGLYCQLLTTSTPPVLPVPATVVAGLLLLTCGAFVALRRSDPGWIAAGHPPGPLACEYCRICRFGRPATAHHCRYCGRCVDGRDHHCHFASTCVGRNNARTFVVFNVAFLVTAVAALGDCAAGLQQQDMLVHTIGPKSLTLAKALVGAGLVTTLAFARRANLPVLLRNILFLVCVTLVMLPLAHNSSFTKLMLVWASGQTTLERARGHKQVAPPNCKHAYEPNQSATTRS